MVKKMKASEAFPDEVVQYDDDGNRVCSRCLCHYSPVMNHTCPEWLVALIEMNKAKKKAGL